MKQLITYLIASIILVSCGSTANVTTQQRYSPNFDYTPPERANPRSAKLTIALINPVFASNEPSRLVAPYSTFVENMAQDFEEMLIAKGFSLRGPFKSRDEMVYGDKENSDIALEIKISLKEDGKLEMQQKTNWGKLVGSRQQHYTVGGSFYHYGTMVIQASDPFTGEKFWKKSVELPRKEINAQGSIVWTGKPKSSELLSKDAGVYNPVAEALEEYYQDAIKTAWRHIDVREMIMIKEEIEKSKIGR